MYIGNVQITFLPLLFTTGVEFNPDSLLTIGFDVNPCPIFNFFNIFYSINYFNRYILYIY